MMRPCRASVHCCMRGHRGRQILRSSRSRRPCEAGGEGKVAIAGLFVEGDVLAFSFQIAFQLEVEIGLYVLFSLA